ncbi:MAG: hypothetical protein A2Z04_08235 [Chloroflexi bacterium RBG_16_57_9]|nr:MAG: hypothetical protein A2Z04_08235 [Chloroflexi bacterium RBG_16_57_9]
MSYQSLTVVGFVGQDPELRYTPDGTPVTTFSVATNRRWTTQDGGTGEKTTWFRVTAWRKTAEVVAQYVSKGRQVLIEGELDGDENGGPRIWTGQDGKARARFEMRARTVQFLGSRSEGGAPSAARPERPTAESDEPLPEDDIPF